MLVLDERQTHNALPMTALIEALRAMFVSGCEMPVRHHHTLGVPGEPDATLLLMPAWQTGQFIGVKIATVFPGNSARGKAAVNAAYVLISAASGEVLAMVDGGELTARRTAAASALAADYLARKDAGHLLVVGTGRLSLNLIEAHAAVRPIRWVTIWGRSPEKAAAVAEKAAAAGFETEATDDLASAVGHADIVSCATLSNEALVHGAWLKPGAHLDLVGAFTPRMRESDDEAMRRASVFVDTRAGATREGGDIVLAMQSGALAQSDIRAELAELTRGEHKGRTSDDEITAFKSVGAALEDLAGAVLAYETAT
ncbi:MAG: ornithine cyclodeaminase family protein [Nitratireductor sp.]|nr:ornithine cyclodeaminase family protein [Nitratireductor sp.]